MTWECVELEVASLFRSLTGNPWYAMGEAGWAWEQRRRAERLAEYREQMTRQLFRYRKNVDQARRIRESKSRIESTRYCKVCKKAYPFTKFDSWRGRACRKRTCSRRCALLASGQYELVRINGRMNTVRGWCLALGIPERTVGHRIRKQGWPVVRALTTPPAARGRGATRARQSEAQS